ncbi:hypothetical protein GCM10023340_43980 [Nocardioides marinquilinus]|uniref:FHA domain-containing protein n=1 Tax=Nocardioides marinquilinus TaxID=1210400 RepID=A0ABP9Q695_9ACTN
MPTVVGADLRFEIERPDLPAVHGRVFGAGNRLTLDVDDPGAFAGPGDAGLVRAAAAVLAARGMSLEIVSQGVPLVTLGAVRVSWWQRRVTRSRHVRLGSLRGAWTAARPRRRGRSVLPDPTMLPPATAWPLAPTFVRRPRRPPTTTHDPERGGGPRLVVERSRLWDGERRPVFWMRSDSLTIGSGPECDARLPGLADVHAVVRHGDDDEFVIEPVGGTLRVHGAGVGGRTTLRTGARIEIGDHVLAFYREEFADHGRPFGGRIGGEAGRQLPQAPRPGRREPPSDGA